MCTPKEEFLDYINCEIFNGKMKETSFLQKFQYKYLTPNTNFVYLARKMWMYTKKGGLWKIFSKFYYLKIYRRYGCCIFPEATIGKGFRVPHPVGIVIGHCEIGNNFTILQGTTIGEKRIGENSTDEKSYPRIGNGVLLSANVCVLGNIVISDNVTVGANAVVCHNILKHGTYVGVPVRSV